MNAHLACLLLLAEETNSIWRRPANTFSKTLFQLFKHTFKNQATTKIIQSLVMVIGHLFPLPRINIGKALLDYKRIAVNILPQVANFQESHLVKNAVKSPNESLPAVLGLDGKHC